MNWQSWLTSARSNVQAQCTELAGCRPIQSDRDSASDRIDQPVTGPDQRPHAMPIGERQGRSFGHGAKPGTNQPLMPDVLGRYRQPSN